MEHLTKPYLVWLLRNVVFRVCGAKLNFYVFNLYNNSDLYDRIYNCLPSFRNGGIPPSVGEMGILFPHPPYAADPMLIIYPLNLEGYMINMGSAAKGEGWGWV